MRLRVVHETRYAYETPARDIVQRLRLTPRDDEGQHAVRWRIEPSIEGRLTSRSDHLGNMVHTFSADRDVSELRLVVSGELVTTDTGGVVRDRAERAPGSYYLRDTELTLADDRIRAFADDVASGGSDDTLALLHRLLTGIHETIRFDAGETQTGTTAAEAFALKRGVCQDMTHIFLAAARHLGVPARYVSGYFVRADGVVQQEAGHAWAEANVPGLGWIGFDPTNGLCSTDAHVRVAIGLDYTEAAPIRGARRGGGRELLHVRLLVEALDSAGQAQSQSQG